MALSKSRAIGVVLFFLGLFGLASARLFFLQVVKGPEFLRLGQNQYRVVEKHYPARALAVINQLEQFCLIGLF